MVYDVRQVLVITEEKSYNKQVSNENGKLICLFFDLQEIAFL